MYMSSLLFVQSATGGWGQRSAGEPQQVVGSVGGGHGGLCFDQMLRPSDLCEQNHADIQANSLPMSQRRHFISQAPRGGD